MDTHCRSCQQWKSIKDQKSLTLARAHTHDIVHSLTPLALPQPPQLNVKPQPLLKPKPKPNSNLNH